MTTTATTSTIPHPRPTVVEERHLQVEVENCPGPRQGQRKLRKATTVEGGVAEGGAAGQAREGEEAEADEETTAEDQEREVGEETTPRQGL
jgi:hypothetical protein